MYQVKISHDIFANTENLFTFVTEDKVKENDLVICNTRRGATIGRIKSITTVADGGTYAACALPTEATISGLSSYDKATIDYMEFNKDISDIIEENFDGYSDMSAATAWLYNIADAFDVDFYWKDGNKMLKARFDDGILEYCFG